MTYISNLYFFIGIISAAFFYTIGSYYFRYGYENNIKFQYIFIISIILGITSFLIKIPIYYYYGHKFTIMHINIYFLIISFILIILYSKFFLQEEIKLHTYIIMTTIILLIIYDQLLL